MVPGVRAPPRTAPGGVFRVYRHTPENRIAREITIPPRVATGSAWMTATSCWTMRSCNRAAARCASSTPGIDQLVTIGYTSDTNRLAHQHGA